MPSSMPARSRGIAFSGPMAAGKTTGRRRLEEKWGFQGLAFADPLKQLADLVQCTYTADCLQRRIETWLDGFVSNQSFYNHFLQGAFWAACLPYMGKNPFPRREFLQRIGTEIGRQINRNLWVTWLLARLPSDRLVVVDDVRFREELEALLRNGFVCIRLTVSQSEQMYRLSRRGDSYNWGVLYHESELSLGGYLDLFHEIWPEMPLEEFLGRVDRLAERVLEAGKWSDLMDPSRSG